MPSLADSGNLPRDVSGLCNRPGRGFEPRLLPSSHRKVKSRMLPRRRACQAHAPLLEWTKFLRFQTRSLVSLSNTPSSSSPSSSSCVCLFFRGGLGAGEGPTRGELVRSTHRIPSPFISSYDFSFIPRSLFCSSMFLFSLPSHPLARGVKGNEE